MSKLLSFSVTLLVICVMPATRLALAQAFMPPPGGYTYSYEANAGEDSPGTSGTAYDALDGTFGYSNNSSVWDGTGIGVGPPGGVSIVEGKYLRIQDTGDPRDYAFPDPSSRKVYLAHKLSADGFSPTFLNDGVTVHFRIRLATTPPLDDAHPDGGAGIVPWPANGDGYRVHDGGKGMVAIRQAGGGIISFSLGLPSDDPEISSPGLLTNHLNGTAPNAGVDTGDAGAPRLIPLDPKAWHEVWVTIAAGGLGTHVVQIYLDGSFSPVTFDVTAGDGDDIGDSYLAFGEGSTAQAGAFDLDFCRIVGGVLPPGAVSSAVPLFSGWILAPLSLFMVGVGYFLLRRRTVLA